MVVALAFFSIARFNVPKVSFVLRSANSALLPMLRESSFTDKIASGAKIAGTKSCMVVFVGTCVCRCPKYEALCQAILVGESADLV